MKLEIKNKNEIYKLNLEQITQLCGTNMRKKNFIINSIKKYFSNKKYCEYESKYLENVGVKNEDIGRNYFTIYNFSSKDDLSSFIKISKTSLMQRYIENKLNDLRFQKEIEKIHIILDKIYNEINSKIFDEFNNILLSYEANDVFSIVQSAKLSTADENFIENMDEEKLMINCLNLLEASMKIDSCETMIIFKNIDHWLEYDEYKMILEKAKEMIKKHDLWFIFCTSIENFVYIDEEIIDGINVINDIIYHFPELENMRKFIIDNYPYYDAKINNKDVVRFLQKIIQNIGNEKYNIDLKCEVILKLINKTICLETKCKSSVNNMESAFIKE